LFLSKFEDVVANKPTYEESEQRVKEAEKEAAERKWVEETLRESEQKLAGIIASVPHHMSMVDEHHNIVWANDVAKKLFGSDLVGKKCYSAYHGYDNPCRPCVVSKCFEDGKVHEHETEVIGADGKRMIFWCTVSVAAYHGDGRPKMVVETSRDITANKRAEKELKKHRDYLEELVAGRTHEISKANEQLKHEVIDRKEAEERLREREAALEIRTNELEQVNTALRVLLKRRDEDKAELEEKLLFNVKELVAPYAEKLKKSGLDAKQLAYLNILESNLNEIISPFAYELSLKYLGLTPAELQTAHLVKNGKTTKEIAELLNVSPLTIESRRKDIRMKIGIRNRKASLRSHLLMM